MLKMDEKAGARGGVGEEGGGGVFQRDLIDDQLPCLILLLFLKHYHPREQKDFPIAGNFIKEILNWGGSDDNIIPRSFILMLLGTQAHFLKKEEKKIC